MKKGKLTSAEKLRAVMGKDSWHNDDLGGKIYRFRVSDGPIGLRTVIDPDDESKGYRAYNAYPSMQVLSHTWDVALAGRYGKAIASDCAEAGVDIILGPAANIKRLPTCGRNFEYVSEDPLLAGYIAKAYIEGVQEEHVGTCLKHYCCNNAEYARLFCSSDVDKRTLREIYLRQFEIAVRAKPWSVMCSYNLTNGVLMSENAELFAELRERLGFDGLIMSDWTAVRRTSRSINAGLDLEMPYNEARAKKFAEDHANGLVREEALDASAGRVTALAEKCGAEAKLRRVTLTQEERDAIALEVAEEGIVLLKNKDGALPLSDETIVVTGAPERKLYKGGGSADVEPEKPYKRLGAALRERGFDAVYRETVRENVGGTVCLNGSDPSCREELLSRDAVIIEVGNNSSVETEGKDRQTIKLATEEEETVKYLAGTGRKVIVIVYAGSAVDMSGWADFADAIVWAGFGGQNANDAVANVLCGKKNPCGKLTETFPMKLEDVKAMHSYRDPERIEYGEKLMVGYRYFGTEGVGVMFPFGFGLSYSSFEYSDPAAVKTEDGYNVYVSVKNTSGTDGKEIVQVYASDFAAGEGRPVKELKGFAKVSVGAGQTVRAEIHIDARDMRYCDEAGEWHDPLGDLSFLVGASCEDIRFTVKI